MAVNVLRGPAGAGKDAWIRENFPDALLADVTLLWAAATGAVRDASGRYPDRLAGEGLRASLYLKAVLIGFASREGIELWATTSSSEAVAVQRIVDRVTDAGGEVGRVETLDPGEDVVVDRLSDSSGELSDECATAVGRWYR